MACKYLHFSPNYTVNDTDTQVVFSFANPASASNEDRFCMKITTDIPTGTSATYTAYAVVNGANIPLWDKFGNPVTVSDLRKNTVYRGFYGSTVPHIVFSNIPYPCNGGCK